MVDHRAFLFAGAVSVVAAASRIERGYKVVTVQPSRADDNEAHAIALLAADRLISLPNDFNLKSDVPAYVQLGYTLKQMRDNEERAKAAQAKRDRKHQKRARERAA